MLLAAPTAAVARLLRSTGLDRSFTIYQDLASDESDSAAPDGHSGASTAPSRRGRRWLATVDPTVR